MYGNLLPYSTFYIGETKRSLEEECFRWLTARGANILGGQYNGGRNRPVLVTNSQEVTPPPDSPHSGDNTGDGGGYARTADLAKAAHALNEFCKECFTY